MLDHCEFTIQKEDMEHCCGATVHLILEHVGLEGFVILRLIGIVAVSLSLSNAW